MIDKTRTQVIKLLEKRILEIERLQDLIAELTENNLRLKAKIKRLQKEVENENR